MRPRARPRRPRRRKPISAELVQLRRDNKRLTEEVEVPTPLASAFFAQWAVEDMKTKHAFAPPMLQGTPSGSCAGSWRLLTDGSTPGGVRPQRELNALPGVAGSGQRSGRWLRAEQEVTTSCASDPCRVEGPKRLTHLEALGRQAHARERHSSTARQAAGADHHRQPPLPCDRAQSARPQLRSRCARCGLAR